MAALFALVLPQIALPVPALEIKLTTLEPALHPAGGDWEESKQNSALMPDHFADFNKKLMGYGMMMMVMIMMVMIMMKSSNASNNGSTGG